jgi:4-hydroxy-3-methylbut-2-enyl diphosphate reductase
MQIILANPRGFCAGVERAIAIVERALEKFGAPIYVRHEVVHNRYVVDGLKAKGAVFVEELEEVPDGATVIFSAHGVPQAVRIEAERRGLKVFDATCPLVTKVHLEVARLHKQGYEIVMIGHRGHPEVEGTMGQATGTMYLVENVDDVAKLEVPKGTHSAGAGGTAPAGLRDANHLVGRRCAGDRACADGPLSRRSSGRARTTSAMPRRTDRMPSRPWPARSMWVIVVGSKNSSNSNRLREVAAIGGIPAYLVDGADQIDPAWLGTGMRVGVTAGASAPEILVNGVVERIRALGAGSVETLDGVAENVNFPLPKELLA